MKKNYPIELFLLFIIVFTLFGNAQGDLRQTFETINLDRDICTYYPAAVPHQSYVQVRESVKKRVAPCSNILVTYTGFTPEAEAAFQFAVDLWEDLLDSSIPIRVDANFGPLDPGVLGSAGPNGFIGLTDGVTTEFYARALAEQILNMETTDTFVDPAETPSTDIIANFSNSANFYFGTDGATPAGQIDFVSVVLHELGHGLGVLGFGSVPTNTDGEPDPDPPVDGFINPGSFPSIWDRFIENGTGVSILDFADPSAALLSEFTSNDLFCNGPEAVAQNGGEPKIYAPAIFNPGSSYSHWDESTYPAGNSESLMTPFIAQGEAIHDPGDAMLGFMQDMGWTICDNRLNTNTFPTNNFKISPNPFNAILTIDIANTTLQDSTFNLEIIDLNGRVIYSLRGESTQGTIQLKGLESLNPAIYFLKMTSQTSGSSITKKIIKK